jgi:hypothetical protein
MTACDLKAQGTCVSQNVSIIDGGMTSYRVRMKVLSAPTQKGARGRIELEDSAENNVHGGTIEVLVCD